MLYYIVTTQTSVMLILHYKSGCAEPPRGVFFYLFFLPFCCNYNFHATFRIRQTLHSTYPIFQVKSYFCGGLITYIYTQ